MQSRIVKSIIYAGFIEYEPQRQYGNMVKECNFAFKFKFLSVYKYGVAAVVKDKLGIGSGLYVKSAGKLLALKIPVDGSATTYISFSVRSIWLVGIESL